MLNNGDFKKEEMTKGLIKTLEEDGFFLNEEFKDGLIFKRGASKTIGGFGDYICIYNIFREEVNFLFEHQQTTLNLSSYTLDVHGSYGFAISFIQLYYRFIFETIKESPGVVFKLSNFSSNYENGLRYNFTISRFNKFQECIEIIVDEHVNNSIHI